MKKENLNEYVKKISEILDDKIKIITSIQYYYDLEELTSSLNNLSNEEVENVLEQLINVKLEDTRRVKYKAIYECNNNTDLPKSKAEYSINNRPEEIDKCLYFGHFELDNVLVLIKENTNVNISQ